MTTSGASTVSNKGTTLTETSAVSLLPQVFLNSSPLPQLLAQGAEALVFRTFFLFPSYPCVLKYRPPKKWRHPVLDARLTRHRILAEARILVKCRREGVPVPALLALDSEGDRDKESGDNQGGWTMLEWIDGGVVRAMLKQWVEMARQQGLGGQQYQDKELTELMANIGKVVGKLHAIGIIHGDLTTSNLMLRNPANDEVNSPSSEIGKMPRLGHNVVIIDFGLAVQSVQDEDRAVDLYVLERAFGSTHPTIESSFREVLAAYGESFKGAKAVLKRLEDVRMRGRKKSMIG